MIYTSRLFQTTAFLFITLFIFITGSFSHFFSLPETVSSFVDMKMQLLVLNQIVIVGGKRVMIVQYQRNIRLIEGRGSSFCLRVLEVPVLGFTVKMFQVAVNM